MIQGVLKVPVGEFINIDATHVQIKVVGDASQIFFSGKPEKIVTNETKFVIVPIGETPNAVNEPKIVTVTSINEYSVYEHDNIKAVNLNLTGIVTENVDGIVVEPQIMNIFKHESCLAIVYQYGADEHDEDYLLSKYGTVYHMGKLYHSISSTSIAAKCRFTVNGEGSVPKYDIVSYGTIVYYSNKTPYVKSDYDELVNIIDEMRKAGRLI